MKASSARVECPTVKIASFGQSASGIMASIFAAFVLLSVGQCAVRIDPPSRRRIQPPAPGTVAPAPGCQSCHNHCLVDGRVRGGRDDQSTARPHMQATAGADIIETNL